MSPITSPRPALTRHAIRAGSVAAAVAQIIALSSLSQGAQAQGVPSNSPLLNQTLYTQYSAVERDFATALADLDTKSNFFCNEGCSSPAVYSTAATLGTLIDTAQATVNGGEGAYGILSNEQFDNTLRWLAPEELFALAPIATGFANGQLGTLDSHMDNTRSISRARLFADNVVNRAVKYGYASNAGAQAGASFSRLNLFFDASAGFGDHADTTDTGSEDAFDFNGNELSLGLDWRFSDNLVAGGLLGYSDRKVDFDVSKSAADGKIDATGISLLGFMQWDDIHWYGSVVAGYQKLSYDFYRRIAVSDESAAAGFPDQYYSPNAAAKGSPDGSGLLASLNVGLPFQWGGWGTDVYIKAAWQKQSVDAYSEDLVDDQSLSASSSGFAFNVGKQDIKSFDTSLGFKVQYVATPSFGVIIPFLRSEFHQQLEDSPHKVNLEFQGLDDINTTGFTPTDLASLQDAFRFQLQSDRPDKSWLTAAVGASAVLRGSSSVSDSGRGSGGLQCYLQYSTVFGLAHYSNNAVTAGLRYEF